MQPSKMIPLKDCKHGYTYRINSRNLSVGIFNSENSGFVGIREKFGSHYLFTEFHRETGAPYGTVSPKEELEKCPLEDIRESLGTFCETCDKSVDFRKENPDGTGSWYHLEKSDCPKALPLGKNNRELFKYLEPIDKRVDLLNYVEDLERYQNSSFFQTHVRWGVQRGLFTEKELAEEFDVSIPTVKRWVSGDNKPAEPMQKYVFEWLMKKAKEKLNA
jgi:hypothetical protein